MLSRHTLVTSLDIGASSTKAVIAEVDNRGYVELLGHGQTDTRGFKNDVINDIRELGDTIATSVEMAEEMASQRAGSLVVAIGGEHVRIIQSQGGILLSKGSNGGSTCITRQDIKNAIDNVAAAPVSVTLKVLHVLPTRYYVDGEIVRNPEGLSGSRLDVDVMIVVARQAVLNSIVKAAEYGDCRIGRFCYRPLATGRAVMNEREMDQGVCLVDVGGRHTDVAIFKEGKMVFTSTLALGGEHITQDSSSHLEVSLAEAERIKLSYGHCTSALAEDVEFQVTGVSDGALWRTIKKSALGSGVIQPRVEEILEESLQVICNSGKQDSLPGGAILTGGTTLLPGFNGLASAIFPFPVHSGINSGFENMDDVAAKPDHATALGLVLFDMDQRINRREDVMDNRLTRFCGKFLRKIHAVI